MEPGIEALSAAVISVQADPILPGAGISGGATCTAQPPWTPC